jgi:hypothetical protein
MKNEEKANSPEPKVAPSPRTDEEQPVFVKKHQSFFEEQPLPVIEMAPRALRYRTRREVFGVWNRRSGRGSRRWISLATKYTQSLGRASKYGLAWEGVVAQQSAAYRR